MYEIRSILAAVDRDGGARQVAGKAAALARLAGASLELFHCDAAGAYVQRYQYDAPSARRSSDPCGAEVRQYLERLRGELAAGDVPVSVNAARESPLYEGVVREVSRLRPQLVVRGIGSEAGTYRARTFGANDWELVRTCPAPLLLTRGRPWSSVPRIGAAVDLSSEESGDLTRAILSAADYFARRTAGTLEFVYAGRFEGATAAELDAQRAALALRAKDVGAQGEARLVVGDPASALPAFAAERRYDLLVLGALTHRKALTALVGTLTGRLIEMLDCDFLLVKLPLPESQALTPRAPAEDPGSTAAHQRHGDARGGGPWDR